MEQNKNMTAVDWFADEILKAAIVFLYNEKNEGKFSLAYDELIEQAKQMEKEQIKAAYNKGYQDGEIDSLDAKDGDVEFFEDAEQYYNETYGGSK
jgi:Zn/Cd-binding protein ZinT